MGIHSILFCWTCISFSTVLNLVIFANVSICLYRKLTFFYKIYKLRNILNIIDYIILLKNYLIADIIKLLHNFIGLSFKNIYSRKYFNEWRAVINFMYDITYFISFINPKKVSLIVLTLAYLLFPLFGSRANSPKQFPEPSLTSSSSSKAPYSAPSTSVGYLLLGY